MIEPTPLKFPKPGKKMKVSKWPTRKRKSVPKVTDKEATLQGWAEDYLNIKGVAFIRIPDTLLRLVFTSTQIPPHQKKIISSYLAGLPDLTIFHPTRKLSKYPIVLSLELKTEAGKTSKKQSAWLESVNGVVAKGWDEIKKEIDDFLDYEAPF